MKCEICGKKPPLYIMLLPIRKDDGDLETMACEECGRKSTAFCLKHNAIHQGFDDGSTACIKCINKMVETNTGSALDTKKKIFMSLHPDEQSRLRQAADMSSSFTGDTIEISVVRFIASKAKRSLQPFERVVNEILQSGSVDCILV